MSPATLASTPGVATEFRESVSAQSKSQWSWAVPVTSQWQVLTIKEVLEAAQLPRNWDTYGSSPPSSWVVNTSIRLVTGIDEDDLPLPHVVPVPEGGIQFEWNVGDRELEIAVLPEGMIEFLKAEQGQPVEEGTVTTYGQLYWLVGWVAKR